jgi:hypothetical protein
LVESRYVEIFMTIEQLKKFHQAQPFLPFTLQMCDGRSLYVPHPEFLSHSPSGRTVVIHQSDDNFSIVDLLLVNQLEIQRSTSSGSNGAA